MLTGAVPEYDGDATLTAVTFTVLFAGIAEGGVYTPAAVIVPTVLLPPATPLTCQFTAVFERLLTVAVKVAVLPNRTWLEPETVTEGCCCCGGVELFPPTEELQPLMKTVTPSKSAGARTRPRSRTFTGGPPYGGETGPERKTGQEHSNVNHAPRDKLRSSDKLFSPAPPRDAHCPRSMWSKPGP